MKKSKFNQHALWKHAVVTPFIWGMLIPVVFADICIEIYHRITFPLYGIPYVKRSQYIKMDRQKLKYLDWSTKVGCAYCGYMNGWFHYATAISGQTEKYWCAIKHEQGKGFKNPPHQKNFIEYGDKKAYDEFIHRP